MIDSSTLPKLPVTRVFIVSEVCYRDNSLLNTSHTTHVHFLHEYRHPQWHRACFFCKRDRATIARGANWRRDNEYPDRPGNRLWLDRTSSRKLLPSTSRLINAINQCTHDRGRSVRFSCREVRNIEIYIASCPRKLHQRALFLSSLCDDPTIRKRGAGRTYPINGTSISVMSASLSVPSRVPTCVENEWSGCY